MAKAFGNPILDPRGRQERTLLKLAPRVSMEALRNGPVVFYDNTKLGFCNYMEVFRRIKSNFAAAGITNIIDFRETVRGKSTQDLKDYAAGKLAAVKPVAAVLALGDVGTSPATTIMTIAMEELGIPSVYVTSPPGSDLVRGVAFYRAGQLCLCPIDIYQGSSVEEIAQKVDAVMPVIFESLTLPPEKLAARAALDFALDKQAPAEDGTLHQAKALELSEAEAAEPAAGIEAVTDLFNDLHLGDGLPIVPPTTARLERMFSYCPFAPDTILAREIGPSGKDVTVRDVAMAAVMAGCKPPHMPILVTAFKAMADKRYNFLQSVTTSHPGGNMILVSGPLAKELGIHGQAGCLGPGFPANMTIGRAVNLVLVNTCRAVPAYSDLACISSQAEISFCFAEDPALTPWKTINAERFDDKTTTVYVLKAEPPHDIIDFLSMSAGDLIDGITDSCTTLGSNNSYMPGPLVVVVTRDHAWLFSREGWTKDAIRRHIHAYAFHPVPMVRGRGLVPVRPADFANRHPMPVTRSPQDIEIVVAGGRGGHSAVILPWALHSEAIVEPVLLPSGQVPSSIEDFKV
ncbi:hypothetical protein [Solidesulfovibrio sp.]|uniref:UGSC family (seleno)protein n=1 Tax=Solidesulfovibrio sp. TaxID=2910990 RepID=UPI002617B558|nr:hypothetical protein [Solidesulfovibrio sp.]